MYCAKRLFKLVDNDVKEYGYYDDIFMKEIFISQTNSSESQWLEFDKVRRTQQALSHRLGDFHEELDKIEPVARRFLVVGNRRLHSFSDWYFL